MLEKIKNICIILMDTRIIGIFLCSLEENIIFTLVEKKKKKKEKFSRSTSYLNENNIEFYHW